jgi:hypothetical protein
VPSGVAHSRCADRLSHRCGSLRCNVAMARDSQGAGVDPTSRPTCRRRRARVPSVVHKRWRASSGGFNVRAFASDRPDRVAGLVLVDASHEDQAHEIPPLARFVPLLSSVGALRLLGITFGLSLDSLPASTQRFARATSFRAAGYQAAADEIIHIRESAGQVRASRRKLTMPVVVVTGARGADAAWRDLQRDQVSLSERGCQIMAEQSGHVVAIDQPKVVVDAIRAIVETIRGGTDFPLCGSATGVR